MSKALPRFWGVLLLLGWSLAGAWAQLPPQKIAKVQIEHVGPVSVNDDLIRANIRTKPGDPYLLPALDEDVRSLYATGLFYNVRVGSTNTPEGLVVSYIVQGNPRLTEIKFEGNKKFRNAKLLKTISSKVGEPFNERKLFTDAQDIQKLYQKKGYPRTEVKYSFSIDPNTARATATFQINESPKIKIAKVEFVGAQAFSQRRLRHVIKTRKHWMFSWITGSGYLKEDQFEEDKEKLADFYRNGSGRKAKGGYLDFEIKNVEFLYPTPRTMDIRFLVYEGTQYHVGSITFAGNKLFTTPNLTNGLRMVHAIKGERGKTGPNGLPMDVGDVFTPKGLTQDTEEVEDFYGSKGYIDVGGSGRNLEVKRIPNTDTGTMDLGFEIQEGQKSYIDRIEIRGNTKTKDKVIRRELAVSPGEVFDMVRVKRSKQRIEGLQYFEKVDTRPDSTDVPNLKNLIIGVDEKNTGNVTMGAGFSSVESLVGYAELTQANFDLFHPPTFTGGGQRLLLRLALGTLEQDYRIDFVEPWFLGHKLQLEVQLYYSDLAYLSPNNLYDVVRGGGRVSLTRTLFSDFIVGSLSYGLEDVGIRLTGSAVPPRILETPGAGRGHSTYFEDPGNVPPSILNETGYNLLSRVGGSLAYDTRNSVTLPNAGQRTSLSAEFVGGPLGGDKEFYKLELSSGWYFKGFAKGHVIELTGRGGVAESLQSGDVPFYERYYLGGMYSLRGYLYRDVAPREKSSPTTYYQEPVGGDSYWFGSVEYSIPIIEQERGIGVRFAVFYDIGNVAVKPYTFNLNNFNDNWGVGLRLNLPIGPIRLDYGIPIHHDQFTDGHGQFQFGIGYARPF